MKLHHRSKVKTQFWQNGLDRAVTYHESIMNTANYSNMLSITRMLQVICRNIPKSTPDTHGNAARVLDLGSGTGILTDTLIRVGYDILSMDISLDMLTVLLDSTPQQSGRVTRGNVFCLPFQKESLDGVVSRWVVPHFPDWLKILVGVHGVLKNNGIFIFDFGSQDNIDFAKAIGQFDYRLINLSDDVENPFFSASCHREKMIALCKGVGYDVVEIVPVNFFLENPLFASILGNDFTEYSATFQERCKSSDVKEFLHWFETEIVSRFPPFLVRNEIIVLQKKA